VNGASESYSFWQSAIEVPTGMYGLSDKCANCDGSVTMFTKDPVDGKYYTIGGSKSLVQSLLNSEAQSNGYALRWDANLYLRRHITIHIGSPLNIDVVVMSGTTLESNDIPADVFKYHLFVDGTTPSKTNEYTKTTIVETEVQLIPYLLVSVGGEVKEDVYVEAGVEHTVGDSVDKLKQYFDSKDYVVGDVDKNTVLDEKSKITANTRIVVMERHAVELEIEKESVVGAEADPHDIATKISAMSGVNVETILVEVETDKNGYVVRVLLFLGSSEQCDVVVNAVNNLKKDGTCPYGIICRVVKARVAVDGVGSLYGSSHNTQSKIVIALITLMFIKHIPSF